MDIIEEYLREHIDEYAPDELAMYAFQQGLSLEFCREWKDRIDFFKLQYRLEEKWKQAASVCCWTEMQEWDNKMKKFIELMVYYSEQYYGFED